MVVNAMVPVGAEMIETQTVGLRINDFQEPVLQGYELRGIHLALENGILNALAIIKACFGCSSQTGSTRRSGGGNIIGDENIHGFEI